MEFAALLMAVLAVIIVIIVNRSKNEVSSLGNVIAALSEEIRYLRKEIQSLKSGDGKTGHIPDEVVAMEPEMPLSVNQSETIETPEPFLSVSPPEVIEAAQPEQIIVDTEPISTSEPVASFTEPVQMTETLPEPLNSKTWYDNWVSKNPDLEKFIGENLINKIGIAVLVLGVAFFVKYAIDQDWINEVGRVCIGIGCGAILVGLAHYLRNSYRSFSSVLAGGGIAVFYFTIAFAFHQYHLMSQTAAFIIMVVITAFAVALSVLYDKLELAVIASVGGFITPFLVSTGEGNYVVLLTYLVILDAGLLALAWFKRWPSINIIALFFTEIIYGSWLGITIPENKQHVSYPVALLFASLYYFIFLGMNMINQVRNKLQFKPIDFSILLLISSSYYAGGMILLHQWHNGEYEGLFTLSMGIINLLLAYYVFKKGKADRNLLFLLIALTFSFITLTIPIQLHGHAITMFWSVEFVLLYWLAGYSGIHIFKYSSAIVCVLTVISLFMDWAHESAYSAPHLFIIFSGLRGIVTNVIAIAAFAVYYMLTARTKDIDFLPGITNKRAGAITLIISFALLYFTCIFGVNLWYRELSRYEIPNVFHRMITELFGIALLVLMQKNKIKANPLFQLAPLAACFIYYLASSALIVDLRDGILGGHYNWLYLYFHLADSMLLCVLFYKTIQSIRTNPEVFTIGKNALSIALSSLIITFFSIELLHVYVVVGFHKNNIDDLVLQYGKAGLTAVWGISSFALMWLGMKHRQKTLRIISLCLFCIVLLKLFIFDISDVSEGGKIFAFILLGVLLLIVSFMYQRLKKIIIDDHKV